MIEKIIITSLVCLAVNVLLKPDMILGLIGEILELFAGFMAKPLGLCLPCSASVYGTLMFFFWSELPLKDYIPFVLAVCAVNYFIMLITSLLEIFYNVQKEGL